MILVLRVVLALESEDPEALHLVQLVLHALQLQLEVLLGELVVIVPLGHAEVVSHRILLLTRLLHSWILI